MTTFMGAFHRWSGFRLWQDVSGDGVSQPTGVAGDAWLVDDPADIGAVAPAGTISAAPLVYNPTASGTVVPAGTISAAPADGTMSGVLTIAGTLTGHFGGTIFNAGSSAFIAPASAGVVIAGAVPILSVVGTAASQQQDHLVFAGGDLSLVYDPTVTGAVAPAGTISAAPAHGTMSGVLTIAGTLTGQAGGTITSAAASAVIAPASHGLVFADAVPILSVADTAVLQPQGHLMFAGS